MIDITADYREVSALRVGIHPGNPVRVVGPGAFRYNSPALRRGTLPRVDGHKHPAGTCPLTPRRPVTIRRPPTWG